MIQNNTEHQSHSVGKCQPFQQIMLVKLDIHIQKNEAGCLPYPI